MKRAATILGALAFAAAVPAAAQSPAAPANQFAPGLRSVKIESRDFARSIAFYTALGMKAGTNRGATQDIVWEDASANAGHDSGVMIVSQDYAARAKIVRGGTYLMILTPDVVALAGRLKAAGFADTPAPRAMGSATSVLLLHDPDGNQIEVLGPPLPN